MNFAQCLYIVFIIGKYTDVFGGIFLVGVEGGGHVGVSFHVGFCELCPMFVYSIYYWEVYRRFWGDFLVGVEGGGHVGVSFHVGIFHGGREFP